MIWSVNDEPFFKCYTTFYIRKKTKISTRSHKKKTVISSTSLLPHLVGVKLLHLHTQISLSFHWFSAFTFEPSRAANMGENHRVFIDNPSLNDSQCFDDDGRLKRTGTFWTASAHIITAVIGSGVLSLAWAIAQLGWIAGPAVMLLFSIITFYTSCLLTDCYRTGDPVSGKRNYTYTQAVGSLLGNFSSFLLIYSMFANKTNSKNAMLFFVCFDKVDTKWRFVGLFSMSIFLVFPLGTQLQLQ